MRILTLIEVSALPLFLLTVVGLATCVIALFRILSGRRKAPYIALSLLLIPLILMLVSNKIAFNFLERAVKDSKIEVSFNPKGSLEGKQFLRIILANFYSSKGASGSRPTEHKFEISLCKNSLCHIYVLAQDSRDSGMYWLSFSPGWSVNYSLGFTRLDNEKI